MSDTYDSRPDTCAHIQEVGRRLYEVICDLQERAAVHDASKLEEPEVSVFNEFTPKLKHSTYGSDEYKAFLAGMGEGLRHHYAVNDHHPEHHENGIWGMDLIQMVEMLADLEGRDDAPRGRRPGPVDHPERRAVRLRPRDREPPGDHGKTPRVADMSGPALSHQSESLERAR